MIRKQREPKMVYDLHIRLSQEDIDMIDSCAKMTDKSKSWVIRESVEMMLKKLKEEDVRESGLKVCPFCGKRTALLDIRDCSYYLVSCVNCRVTTAWYKNPQEAIDAWNKRADSIQKQ